MQFGAATPRRQQIDINVIPQEFRRRQFPVLTAGLALVLVGSLLLLYGLFYLKSYADLEITAFRSRITPAQEAVRAATANEEAASQAAQRYAGQRADYRLLAERQVRWSSVLQAVSSPPPGVTVREISQAGYTVSVLGSAPEFSQAVKFLESLRATDLFSNSSIELVDSSLLAGTPTPRSSYGTPTATRPAGAVVPFLTPSTTAPLTPTPSRTPTVTYTPNAAATATAKALWTATAKAGATNTAIAAKTQTALARPASTATKTRTPTRTPVPPTATPIRALMTLPIAASEVTEVGGTTSGVGLGPAMAVDQNTSTAWVPNPNPGGNSGRWIQIDLSASSWFTPGTDVVWSVSIVPSIYQVAGQPPSSPKGRYFVYAYDTSGKSLKVDASGRALPICDQRDVDWTKANACWLATSNANQPLEGVSVIDVGVPSTYPTDGTFLYGIAEIVVEVNQRGPSGAAPAGAGPVGLGGLEAPGTATVVATTTLGTPTPIRTVLATRTVYPAYGTPTPTMPGFSVPTPPRPTPSVVALPTTGPIPVPPTQTTAEFLILLEVKPGEGYK